MAKLKADGIKFVILETRLIQESSFDCEETSKFEDIPAKFAEFLQLLEWQTTDTFNIKQYEGKSNYHEKIIEAYKSWCLENNYQIELPQIGKKLIWFLEIKYNNQDFVFEADPSQANDYLQARIQNKPVIILKYE